jgi:hypothetical protein
VIGDPPSTGAAQLITTVEETTVVEGARGLLGVCAARTTISAE